MEPYAAKIVGILNVTEDSFSDGGRYLDHEAAVAHGRRLRADGADVVEIGAASSAPDAAEVASAEEIRRIAPVIDALRADGIPVSVDTRCVETQRYCIGRGVDMVNDVDGFAHPELYPELARSTGKARRHALRPRRRACNARRSGRRHRVRRHPRVLLPAACGAHCSRHRARAAHRRSGHGTVSRVNSEPSLRVLRNIASLRERFGVAVLVSVSRKSFLRALTGRSVHERGAATLAAEIWAAAEGVDYIRTHDVSALRDALNVLAAIRKEEGA
jgi:dihydropteroate synthase type 2